MPRTMMTLLTAATAMGAALACTGEPAPETNAEATPEAAVEQPAPAATPAPEAAGATVAVRSKEGLGEYLTDANGRSLYLFLADSTGAQPTSNCYEACAEAWPPLLTTGQPVATDPEVGEAMLGTIERQDGSMQVTYGGWPLYYFVKDENPGDILGQDIEGFGAEWYLVEPDGTKLEEGGE